MTHQTNALPNERQRTMFGLLMAGGEYLKATELAAILGQKKGTTSANISYFMNELEILDYDAGGYYRLTPGREAEAMSYFKWGRDAFAPPTLLDSAREAVLKLPEFIAYVELMGYDMPDPADVAERVGDILAERRKEFR